MRKSIRLFSILAMALMMTLSFVFASSMLVKADTSVDFGATDGASVYLPGDEFDLGLNFEIRVDKADYTALIAENANKNVWFGAQFMSDYSSEPVFVWGNKDGNFIKSDEDNYYYNASYIVDMEAEYNAYLTTIDEGATALSYDAFKITEMVEVMAVVPVYAVFEGEFDASAAYIVSAEMSDVRSMLTVANAVDVAGENVPENFADKYNINATVSNKEIVINADGSYESGAFAEDTVMVTIGDNAELLIPENGKLYTMLGDKTVGELAPGGQTIISAFAANQETYELSIARYKATVIDAEIESLPADANGKVYFNSIAGASEEVWTKVLVNGVNVLKADGTLNLALANKKVGDKFSAMFVNEELNVIVNEIEVYDMVFENTAESRELMAQIFRGREEDNGVLAGSYALAENLYFNHYKLDENGEKTYDENNNVIYSNAEAFNGDSGFKRDTGAVDEETGDPIMEKITNVFKGTFDGRGFAMNNVLMDAPGENFYGIFGAKAGDGAVIKNVAINDVYKMVNKTTVNQEKAYDSLFFHSPESAEAVVTLQNVYVYRKVTSNNSNGSLMYYNLDGAASLNTFVMDNVIIVYNNDFDFPRA